MILGTTHFVTLHDISKHEPSSSFIQLRFESK